MPKVWLRRLTVSSTSELPESVQIANGVAGGIYLVSVLVTCLGIQRVFPVCLCRCFSAEAAQRFTQGAMPFGATEQASAASGAAAVAAAKAAGTTTGTTEEVDMTGVDPKDVQLIVSQLRCTTEEAVKALRDSDNDLVEAILQLSAN